MPDLSPSLFEKWKKIHINTSPGTKVLIQPGSYGFYNALKNYYGKKAIVIEYPLSKCKYSMYVEINESIKCLLLDEALPLYINPFLMKLKNLTYVES